MAERQDYANHILIVNADRAMSDALSRLFVRLGGPISSADTRSQALETMKRLPVRLLGLVLHRATAEVLSHVKAGRCESLQAEAAPV